MFTNYTADDGTISGKHKELKKLKNNSVKRQKL